MIQSYANKVSDLMQTTGSRLCLGIDPPCSIDGFRDAPFFLTEWRRDSIGFVNNFCATAIEAAQGLVASIKFQSAFFEALGAEGYALLKPRMAQASASGISVILDVKRGDISSTMSAYGKSAFDQLGADAMTINTYMGADVLEAILPWLQKGRGAYIVWMTSNLQARAIQGAKLESGQTIAELIFEQAVAFGDKHRVQGGLGFVLGTTRVDELTPEQTERLADYSVLLPGLGPQGGIANQALKHLIAACPSAVVAMSRGLTGIGDPAQTPQLADIHSWEAYGAYVHDRISVAADDLAC